MKKSVSPSSTSHVASYLFAVSVLNASLRSHVNGNGGCYTHDMFALLVTLGALGSVASTALFRVMYGSTGGTTHTSFVSRLRVLLRHGLVVKKWSRGAYRYSLSPLCLRMVRDSIGKEALRGMYAIVRDALR